MHKSRLPRLARLALALPLAAILLSGCFVVPRDGYGGHHVHHGRGGYYKQDMREAVPAQPAPYYGRRDGR